RMSPFPSSATVRARRSLPRRLALTGRPWLARSTTQSYPGTWPAGARPFARLVTRLYGPFVCILLLRIRIDKMALHHLEAGEVARASLLGKHLQHIRTYALVKTNRFEAVRLVIPAGTRIAEHLVDGPVTLHCLEGKFARARKAGNIAMEADDWVHLDPGE